MEKSFDPYAEWLGIARRSGRPNHYALLGLAPFESDTSAILAAAERRMSALASIDPGAHEQFKRQLIAEVTRARQVLSDVALKKQYDESLRAKATSQSVVDKGHHAAAEARMPHKEQASGRPASDELRPPRAISRRPPPEVPAAGDPMAPVLPASALGDPMAPLALSPVEQITAPDSHVEEISDQLANARMAARKLAVRRQKAPYWVLASLLTLLCVIGVALVVAYANGLIHLGPLPELAQHNDVEPLPPTLPSPDAGDDDSWLDSNKSDAKTPSRANKVQSDSHGAPVPASKTGSDQAIAKSEDPPVDPELEKRVIAELAAARKALGERKAQAAKEHIAAATQLATSGEPKQLVEGFKALPKYIDGFWEAVREGTKGLEVAGELKVGNTFVSIVEIRSGQLTIRANGQNHRYPLDELPAGLAVAIAKRWFDDRPDNKVYLGAFYFVDPRTDVAEAKRLWDAAASAGVNVKGLLALIPIAAE